jgi:hypothetical protein
MHSYPQRQVNVTGQFHIFTALSSQKQLPEPTAYQRVGWSQCRSVRCWVSRPTKNRVSIPRSGGYTERVP